MEYFIFEFQTLSSQPPFPTPLALEANFESTVARFQVSPIRNYIQVYSIFTSQLHLFRFLLYPVSNSLFVYIYCLGWHNLRITHKLLAIVACRKLKRSFGIAENDLSSSNVVSVYVGGEHSECDEYLLYRLI